MTANPKDAMTLPIGNIIPRLKDVIYMEII